MRYIYFYLLTLFSCSLVQSAQDLYDFIAERDAARTAVSESKQEADIAMQDASGIDAVNWQIIKNSPGYTGEVLTKFQYWPKLPIDIKRKIMDRARANSALRAKVPVVCRILQDAVSSVVLKENKVVSGSDNAAIRLWDLEAKKQQMVWIQRHGGPIYSVALEGNRVVSGIR